MKCRDCQYFHIRQMPIKGWDFGIAECKKHNLVVDFASMRKVNTLECVEETSEDRKQEQTQGVQQLSEPFRGRAGE